MKQFDYDEFLRLIKTRRSCRNYSSEPVDNELVDKVIEAGLWSASAHGTQSTKIIRVKQQSFNQMIRKKTKFIMGITGEFDPFYGAPEILIVCAPKNEFAPFDGSLVIGHMMDSAHALGLGSCWINTAQVEQYYPDSILKIIFSKLDLENHIGIGYLALGYPDSNSNIGIIQRKDNRVFEI